MQHFFMKLFFFAASALVFTGCGDSDSGSSSDSNSNSEEFGTIRGTITYEGEIPEDGILYGGCNLEGDSPEGGYQSENNFTFPHEYEFRGLIPGSYSVGFYINDGNMDPATLAEIDFGSGGLPDMEIIVGSYDGEIIVAAGDIIENIDIVLSMSGGAVGENTVSGTVLYDGETTERDVLRGYIFDNPAFDGLPSYDITVDDPVFPQAFIFEGISVGEWFVSFVFDIGGDNSMGPGDEDLRGALVDDVGTSIPITLEEGGNVADLEITIITE